MIDEHITDPTERRILALQRERNAYRRALVALSNCASVEDVRQIAVAVLERMSPPSAPGALDVQPTTEPIRCSCGGNCGITLQVCPVVDGEQTICFAITDQGWRPFFLGPADVRAFIAQLVRGLVQIAPPISDELDALIASVGNGSDEGA